MLAHMYKSFRSKITSLITSTSYARAHLHPTLILFFLQLILILESRVLVFPRARKLHQVLPSSLANTNYKRPITSPVDCRSAADLVEALSNPPAQFARVLVDITLTASDFASPIQLNRNFTIMGAYEEKQLWPLFDMGFVSGVVELETGVTLNFTNLALARVRRGPHFQIPGMDIIAFKPKDAQPYAFVIAWRCVLIQRTCLPDSMYAASTISLTRPTELPPAPQHGGRIAQWEPCSNNTADATMLRCWCRVGLYEDILSYSSDLVGADVKFNNYMLWVLHTYYVCDVVMSDDCVRDNSPIYCFYNMFPRDENNKTAEDDGSKSISVLPAIATGTQKAPLEPPLAQLPQQQQQTQAPLAGLHEQAKTVPLAAVLEGVLSAAAGLGIAAAVILVAVRRRWWMDITNKCWMRGQSNMPCSNKSNSNTGICHYEDGELASRPSPRAEEGCTTGDSRQPTAIVSIAVTHLGFMEASGDDCNSSGDVCETAHALKQSSSLNTASDCPSMAVTAMESSAGAVPVTSPSMTLTGEADRLICCKSLVHYGDAIPSPITANTRMQGYIRLGVDSFGGEVHLTSESLGRGGFGRVVVGILDGQRVAVKLLNSSLLEQVLAAEHAMKGKMAPAGGGGGIEGPPQPPPPVQLMPHQQGRQQPSLVDTLQQQPQQHHVHVEQDGQQPTHPQQPHREQAQAELGQGQDAGSDEQQHEEQLQAEGQEDGRQVPLWITTNQVSAQIQEGQRRASFKAARAFITSLMYEVDVLARCHHPNIVRLLAARLSRPNACLVIELMDTSLDRLLHGRVLGDDGRNAKSGDTQKDFKGGAVGGEVQGISNYSEDSLMPLEKVLYIGMQIAQALSYLHPTILHRDLKPANVLLSQPHSLRPIVKLADFGLSRLRNSVLVTRNPEVGTAPYMAPETFDLHNQLITDRVDIYALGVILWEMLAGVQPWEGKTSMQIAYRVTLQGARLPFQVICEKRRPAKLVKLITACWDADPARRPAGAEVVKTLALLTEQVQRAKISA